MSGPTWSWVRSWAEAALDDQSLGFWTFLKKASDPTAMPSHWPMFMARLTTPIHSFAAGVSLQLLRSPPTHASLPNILATPPAVSTGGVFGYLPPWFWKANPFFSGLNPVSARIVPEPE